MSVKNNENLKAGLKMLANATNKAIASNKATAPHKLGIKPFDAADYLTSEARIFGYLNEAAATGDPAVMQLALGAVARARGMGKVAKASGLSRENLYRSLKAGTVTNFDTIVRVADALGFVLAFKPEKPRAPRKTRAVIAGKGSRSSARYFKKAVKR